MAFFPRAAGAEERVWRELGSPFFIYGKGSTTETNSFLPIFPEEVHSLKKKKSAVFILSRYLEEKTMIRSRR